MVVARCVGLFSGKVAAYDVGGRCLGLLYPLGFRRERFLFLFFRIFGGGFASDSCLDAACLALGCLSFLLFLASLRWRSAAVAFWFAIARAKPGGICFRGVCSFRMRLAVGDQCVLAALRSCAHLWSLQEALCSFELRVLRFVFRYRAFLMPFLQDWWVDQHGYTTRWALPKLWNKAVRYTDWAQESLSGPVGVDDLLTYVV